MLLWDVSAFLLVYLLCGSLGGAWLQRHRLAVAGGVAALLACVEVPHRLLPGLLASSRLNSEQLTLVP